MRFLADRAVAHRAGLEAGDEALDGLDLVEGDRVALLEIEQAAQRREVACTLVDERCIGLVGGVTAGAHRFLQAMDALGVEDMELAVGAPLVLPARGQRRAGDRTLGEGCAVAHQRLLGDHVETDAADARRRSREVLVDQVLTQAHGLEHLRTVVALHRGDAHLGHHLDHALGRRLGEVRTGEFVVNVGQEVVADHAVERLEGEVGVHHIAAVADQEREVMDLARLAGLQGERHAGA